MPNWCDNTLTVKGTPDELERFKKLAKPEIVILFKKEDIEAEAKNILDNKDKWSDNLEAFAKAKIQKPALLVAEKHFAQTDSNGNIVKRSSSDLSLNKLYPMPEELLKYTSQARPEHGEKTDEDVKKRVARLEKKYGTGDLFQWKNSNWGTKWDVEATLEEFGNTELMYQFDSAWSPPENWLRKIALDFPTLSFRLEYSEPGLGFQGVLAIENGEVIEEYSGDYEYNDDELEDEEIEEENSESEMEQWDIEEGEEEK